MKKAKRIQLEDEIKLSLREGEEATETFKIEEVIGEGGSTICYWASCGDKEGRLKEFYPVDIILDQVSQFVVLERDQTTKQIVPKGSAMTAKYKEMRNDFIDAYVTLEGVKKGDEQNKVLNNYIPPYTLLYGESVENGISNVYVWTPDDKSGKNFADYLAEVHKQPKKRATHKLFDIIDTIISLTDCIKAIHAAGLLHLDIKPSNFLVPYDSDFRINTATISLFDINTMHSIYSDYLKVAGTVGYQAPEVEKGKADNRSDIYSIGAMLFIAIVVNDDIADKKYKKEYYSHIPQLINTSKLLDNASSNSNTFLHFHLSEILKKCLATRPKQRYDNCEDLIKDLQEVRTLLLPEVKNDDLEAVNKKLKIIDKEVFETANPTAIMQNLLYKFPILDFVPEGSKNMNVLVLGAGTYAQKFIDICLQAGQIPNYKLNIKAVSDKPEYDKEVYLHSRPAISEFVDINRFLRGKVKEEEIYATLDFIRPSKSDDKNLSKEGAKINREIIEDLMLADGENPYLYVFIALGDDELNHEVAKATVDTANNLNLSCHVNFVVQDKDKKKEDYRKGEPVEPVFVNESISTKTIDKELERMAFNVHLSWSGVSGTSVDLLEKKKEFKQPYNYKSSIANALAIRYKLRSVGINESEDLKKAAELFSEKILNENDKALFNDMVAFEHRRWVIEKVTEGWRAHHEGKIDYDACVRRGSVKDNVKKLHPCIVRSGSETPLQGEAYQENNREKWNEIPVDETLDELDSMSIHLHQTFKRHAEAFKKEYSLSSGDFEIIQQKIHDGHDDVVRAYNEFQWCLRNILNGNYSYTKQYKIYEKAFEDTLHLLPEEVQNDIRGRLKSVKKAFFPVTEYSYYRDYKSLDEALIEKIPFILTYDSNHTMAVIFNDGDGTDASFSNVASATMINPKKVNYLYYFDGRTEWSNLIQKIRSVLHYYKSTNMRSEIRFTMAISSSIDKRAKEKLYGKLETLKDSKMLKTYQTFECENEEAAVDWLLKELHKGKIDFIDSTEKLFSSLQKSGFFTYQLSQQFSCFEFTPTTKMFNNINGCEQLAYIGKGDKSFIRIKDMFSLNHAVDDKFNLPEFAADYEFLWNIYSNYYKKSSDTEKFSKGIRDWNKMCDALNKYSTKRDHIVTFGLESESDLNGEQNDIHLSYYFPEYSYPVIKKILTKLKEYGTISENSIISKHTSDTCKVDIFTVWNIKDEMEILASKIHFMADAGSLNIYKTFERDIPQIFVSFDNLAVNHLDLGKNEKFIVPILETLSKKNFINGFKKHDKKVSFVYSSRRIKEMLTSAGKILEVHVYYEVLKSGYFDDIASGYEFQWEYGGVRNELDCILTKGFKSIIVECKGSTQIAQDAYFKLRQLTDQFGVDCKCVLVANTQYHTKYLDTHNDMQRARGEQMGIITVSNPNEILNIGKTLKKIMESM